MSKGKKKNRSINLEKLRKQEKRLKLDKREIALGVAMTLFPIVIIISANNAVRYSFVNAVFFPLWYVALALGVAAGLFFSIKFVGKEQGVWARIGIFAIITAITCYGFGSVFAHLNHWFDTREPIRYEVVIEDKDRYKRRKGPNEYELAFTIDGETFDVNVPGSDYRNYKEGDTYVVEYHEGAFGEPYFMSVGWSKDPPELPPSAQEPIEE